MSGGQGSEDGTIDLRGVIKNGTLVDILDHQGKPIGAPLFLKASLNGGKYFAGERSIADDGSASSAGGVVYVAPFSVGGFSFSGGSITCPADGAWYVGVDIFSKALITLPRLGHRGWIPVAKVEQASSIIVSISQIVPAMPASRLPRVTKKILDGKAINVLVMGSSLAEGGATTDWSGMLFNAASMTSKYKVPGSITFNNVALGGMPNQFQLAQLGVASNFLAFDYQDSGYAGLINHKMPPNGRSTLFTGVDLVVITLLANGGDYRLQCIEPIIRKLRQLGIEVVLTTDNPQGYPFASYSTMASAALHVDGPEVARIADLYNVEFADTSAYVVDATLRYPGVSIFRDSIHMYSAEPAGRTGQPSGGYEIYARAIRSVIPVDANRIGTVTLAYDFNSSVLPWSAYTQAIVSIDNGALKVAKNGAASAQWGAGNTGFGGFIPSIKSGDTVRVQGTLVDKSAGYSGPAIGLQGGGGGWGSNAVGLAALGAFDITLTAIRDIVSGGFVLLFGNLDAAADGTYFKVDNLSITVNSTYESAAFEVVAPREYESQSLPPCRVVTDLKTPGDAFVILPKDENHYVTGDGTKGTLGASPNGAASFARRFSSLVGAAEDILTLTTGQRAALAANGTVGLSLIYCSVNGDPQVTFDVYKNNNFSKTVTIQAQTISREIYLPIYTPTEHNNSLASPMATVIDIRVTSGTLRIAALVALTFDQDYVMPEAIARIGTWTGKVPGGPPNMMGYGTDTLNDKAYLKCPDTGRRVAWLCSGKPNSKPINTWCGRTSALASASAGNNHVFPQGNHVGPGDYHFIQLAQAQPNTDQAINGYGLHIGGAIIINDR